MVSSDVQCDFCKSVFKSVDELQSHLIDSCAAIEDEEVPNPVHVSTQEITQHISPPDNATPSPEPPVVDHQLLSKGTAEESLPDEEATPEPSVINNGFVTEITTTLARFCVDAPTTEVRDCIRQYKAEKTYKQLKTSFTAFSKPTIVQTLCFLGHDQTNWEDHLKASCIHELICRIQSLLPEDCIVCKESYTIQKTDPPLLSCSICRQEVHHKCYKPLLETGESSLMNMLKIPGFHYLCPSCVDDMIPDKDDGLIKKKRVANPQPTLPVDSSKLDDSQLGHSQTVSSESTHKPADNPVSQLSANTNSIKSSESTHKPADNPVSQLSANTNSIKSFSHTSKTPSPLNPNVVVTKPSDDSKKVEVLPDAEKISKEEEKGETTKKTCSHYKNNGCKYGISGKGCDFFHPKRCSKLMNHGTKSKKGCNLGRKCPAFHPKMCPMSISKLECFDTKCNLCHVKGTKRKKEPPTPQTKKAEITSNKPTAGDSMKKSGNHEQKEMSNVPNDIKSLHQSFLDQISLLRQEFQEAMDQKMNTLLQAPHPRNPFQPQFQPQTTPNLLHQYPPFQLQPQHPHNHALIPQVQYLPSHPNTRSY